MAYNPTVWEENDLLSADRMNKIEQGIAGASETPDGLLPAGGTAGQMLVKTSDGDFDVEWADALSGDSILTIEDYTITDPQDIPDILGSNEYLGFVHLKNTTIYDVLFENEIVLFEYDYSKLVNFDINIKVYSILEGKKYTFMCDPDPSWGDPHKFYRKDVSDVPWDVTMQAVEAAIHKNNVYAHVDNFFDVYGIDKEGVESKYVSFKTDGQIQSQFVKSSDTVYDVISDPAFNNEKFYYDNNTGKIYSRRDKESTLVTISVDGNDCTPTPIPVSFVTSFNGRNGAVMPQEGDYTAEMVGAIASDDVKDIIKLTESEYNALGTKFASTLYLIREEE